MEFSTTIETPFTMKYSNTKTNSKKLFKFIKNKHTILPKTSNTNIA